MSHLPKKQLGSFLNSHLRGEDFVWSNRYPAYYSPSFLNKRFKSNVNETNNYDLFFRGARQLVDKKAGTSSIIHLVVNNVDFTGNMLITHSI